jgi:DnaK suppressor protein
LGGGCRWDRARHLDLRLGSDAFQPHPPERHKPIASGARPAAERRDLEDPSAIAGGTDDGEIAGFQEPSNLASELNLDKLDEALAADLHERLEALERAEKRLATGTYGLSIESGEPIPDERLEAFPTAERTVEEERVLTERREV